MACLLIVEPVQPVFAIEPMTMMLVASAACTALQLGTHRHDITGVVAMATLNLVKELHNRMDKHFERGHVGQQLIVAASFEPIIQRSVGSSPKLAFKATLATQPGKTACARSRNDRPARLDLAILDDF